MAESTVITRQPWRRVSERILDILLPPRCLKCTAPVSQNGSLCAACWDQVSFIAAPICGLCGVPFDHDPGPDALCGLCSARKPPYRRARAVFVYDEFSRDLVLAFKHADRTQAAPAFGRWLARAGGDMLEEADLIAPVPLHRRRLFARRFNQAALLAAATARLTHRPYAPALLIRRRATPSQGRQSPSARRRNVKGAFALHRRADVSGRHILLIDDVFTTGATVGECARVLLRSGARAVDVLTLARVVRPGDPF